MPLKEEIMTCISQEMKVLHACHTGPRGKSHGGQEAEDRSQEKARAKAFVGIPVGKAE